MLHTSVSADPTRRLRHKVPCGSPNSGASALHGGVIIHPIKWEYVRVLEEVSVAQARILLASLYEHVEEISLQPWPPSSGDLARRQVAQQRCHTSVNGPWVCARIYEAHRLIDALHLRFPTTREAASSVRRYRTTAEHVGPSVSQVI